MANSDVSVVIRSCGRASLLQRALNSLEAQTLMPREIVVVGIGADGVEAFAAARAPASTRLVSVAEKRMRGAALNDGVRVTQAPWIAFLDDDDTWAPSFLEEMTGAAAAQITNLALGGIACQTEAVYERMKNGVAAPCGREPFNPWLASVSPEALFRGNCFTINAAIWKQSVFEMTHGFSEDLPVLEDWDFNMRAATQFHIAVLPRMLARYHQRPPADAMPNTRMNELNRMALRLQRGWLRSRTIGNLSAIGRFRLAASLLSGASSRFRAQLCAWRRWKKR